MSETFFDGLLSRYIDGELTGSQAKRVVDAFLTSPALRARYKELKQCEAKFTVSMKSSLESASTPPFFSSALFLVGVDGKSYQEAAEILSCSTDAIADKVARARLQLAALHREESTHAD